MNPTPAIFYGGEASQLGTVNRLPVSSWKQFVQEILGHPALVNVTREQFAKLPKEQRNQLKRVPYVTPATFTGEDVKRVYANAKDISLIALDIDDPNQARPLARDPGIIKRALEPLNFAAYHTASSTTDNPKLRIFVPAASIAIKHYPNAVLTVARLLGLAKVTSESKVSVQPMYLPTQFRDEERHPLLASVTNGEPFTQDDVKTFNHTTAHGPAENLTDDDLDFIRATVDDITPEDAQLALKHVSPDLPYLEWLEVAAALRHQFPKDAEQAYKVFDSWSSDGEKYVSTDDTRAKWNSLRPTPKGRAPITIRSLFHRATEGGWQGAPTIAAKAYAATLQWLVSRDRTSNDLMQHGLKRIAAAPLQSQLEKGSLVNQLRTCLAAQGVTISASDLKKDLRRIEHRQTASQTLKPEDETETPDWARGICYVAAANEFYQRSGDRHYPPDVLDSVFGVHLMSNDSQSGRPAVRPRDFLLNMIRVPRVDHYRYDPGHPEKTFFSVARGHRYVNLYLPTYPEPDHDHADSAGEVLCTHLEHLVAEPAYRRTMLDFMAYHVQFPGRKIRWALVVQGAQGCGKTALAKAMTAVLGGSNVTIMDAALLFTAFNSWATGAQLVCMEEIRVVGHNRHEVMNRLKPCISNDTVMVRQMRMDAYQTPNVTNYVMFTNHHDSLAVTEEDRRYFVVNSALQNKAQVKALGPKYFPKLFGMIAKQPAGLRAFLEQHKIHADFQPDGHAPHSKYLLDLTLASANPLTAAARDILNDGPHALVKQDLVSTKFLKPLLELENVGRFSDQQLGATLRELDYVQHGRFRIEGDRHYVWAKRGAFLNNAAVENAVLSRAGNSDSPLL